MPPSETGLKPKTIGEAVQALHKLLEDAGIEESRLEAEILVSHVLDTDRTQVFVQWTDPRRKRRLAASCR
jgi:methylase of polypeptide subunit release factors